MRADPITLDINGRKIDVDAEPDTPLVWVIREQVGLSGTKSGYDVRRAGSHQRPRRALLSLPVSAATRREIDQRRLVRERSHPAKGLGTERLPQSGCCQSGMIIAAAALLQEPKPTDADIDACGHQDGHQDIALWHAPPPLLGDGLVVAAPVWGCSAGLAQILFGSEYDLRGVGQRSTPRSSRAEAVPAAGGGAP